MTEKRYTAHCDHSCSTCATKTSFDCTVGKKSKTLRFYSSLLTLFITSLGGIIYTSHLTGIWWSVALFFLFWVTYQLCNELLLHCPRCPYWNDHDDKITCIVNCGIQKPTWKWIEKHLKYNPRPYNKKEIFILSAFNNFSVIYPLGIMAYGLYSIREKAAFAVLLTVTIIYLLSVIVFTFVLKRYYCKGCAHLSCPLNTISKDKKEFYLKSHQKMAKAWDDAKKGQ